MPFTPSIPNGWAASAATSGALPGPTNNNTSTVGTDVQSQAVVRTLYDYNPFAILQQVVVRNDQRVTTFRFLLEAMGMSRGVNAPTTGHFEMGRPEQNISFSSIVTASTGPGTNVTAALTADNMFSTTPTQTANGVAVQGSYPRAGDIIELGQGKKCQVISKITNTNPHRLVLRPLSTTVDLVGAITLNTGTYSVFTNAFAEASGLPTGRLPQIFKYINSFQIVKEAYGVTGSALADDLFVRFDQAPNNTIEGIINPQALVRCERNVSNALLFGVPINNITTFSSITGIDHAVSGTEGVLTFAETLGHIPPYTAGAYSLTDFDRVGQILTAEGVATNRLWSIMGNSVFTQIENVLFSYFQGGANAAPMVLKDIATQNGVNMDAWSPFEDANFSFYVGFKAVRKNGYDFLFTQLPEFVDPTLGGNPTYTYGGYVFTTPVGQRKDRETGLNSPLMGYEWKQNSVINRRAAFGKFSGIGAANFSDFGPAVRAEDYAQAGMLAEVAAHCSAGNQMVLQKPA